MTATRKKADTRKQANEKSNQIKRRQKRRTTEQETE